MKKINGPKKTTLKEKEGKGNTESAAKKKLALLKATKAKAVKKSKNPKDFDEDFDDLDDDMGPMDDFDKGFDFEEDDDDDDF